MLVFPAVSSWLCLLVRVCACVKVVRVCACVQVVRVCACVEVVRVCACVEVVRVCRLSVCVRVWRLSVCEGCPCVKVVACVHLKLLVLPLVRKTSTNLRTRARRNSRLTRMSVYHVYVILKNKQRRRNVKVLAPEVFSFVATHHHTARLMTIRLHQSPIVDACTLFVFVLISIKSKDFAYMVRPLLR